MKWVNNKLGRLPYDPDYPLSVQFGGASGIECTFIPKHFNHPWFKFNKIKIGLKLYNSKSEALTARKMQIKAWKKKVGPAVYGRSIIAVELAPTKKHGSKSYKWGYFTQIVKTIDSYNSHIIHKQDSTLRSKLEKLKIPTGDLHSGNLGVLRNKLVVIDFGEMTMVD